MGNIVVTASLCTLVTLLVSVCASAAPPKPVKPSKPAPTVPNPAASLAPGTAKGMLTVGDKRFTLTHAYAQAEDDAEGPMPDGRKRNLVVLLADTEVAPDDAADFFRCAKLARENKLHGVMLQIDPDKKQMYLVQVMHIEDPKSGPPNISLSGTGLNHRLGPLTLSKSAISGVVQMQKPDEWVDFASAEKERMFQYQATFNAPIRPPLPITATLTGKAAQDSPQVAATLALFTALRANDFETVRRVAMPANAQQVEDAYKQLGPAKFKEMAAQMAPPPEQFKKELKKVIVRGDRKATILFGNGNLMRLVRDGDAWKVSD